MIYIDYRDDRTFSLPEGGPAMGAFRAVQFLSETTIGRQILLWVAQDQALVTINKVTPDPLHMKCEAEKSVFPTREMTDRPQPW